MQEFNKFHKQQQENDLKELIYSRVLKLFFSQTSDLSKHLDTLCFEALNQVVSLAQEDGLISQDSNIQLNFINRFIKKTPSLKLAADSLLNFRSALSEACLNYTDFIKSDNGLSNHDFYTQNVRPLLEQLTDDHPQKLICLLNSLNYNLVKNEGIKPRQTRFYRLFADKGDSKVLNQQIDLMRNEVDEANSFIAAFVADLLVLTDSISSVFLIDELKRIASQVFDQCLINFYKYDDNFSAEIDFNECLFANTCWSDNDHAEINLNGKRFLNLEEFPIQIERSDEQELSICLVPDLLESHLQKQFFEQLELSYRNLLWKLTSLNISLIRLEDIIILDLSQSKLLLDDDLPLKTSFLLDDYYDFSNDDQDSISPTTFAFISNQFNEEQWFKIELNSNLQRKFNTEHIENTTRQISFLIKGLENPLVSLEHNKFNTENYNVTVKASAPFRHLSFGLNREDFDYLHRYADLLDLNGEFDYYNFYKSINYNIPGIVLGSQELQKLFTITNPVEILIGQGLESFWIKHNTNSTLMRKKKLMLLPKSNDEYRRDRLAKRFQICFENGLEKINNLLQTTDEVQKNAKYPLKMSCGIAEGSTKNQLQLDFRINLKISSNIELERVITAIEDGKVILRDVKDFQY